MSSDKSSRKRAREPENDEDMEEQRIIRVKTEIDLSEEEERENHDYLDTGPATPPLPRTNADEQGGEEELICPSSPTVLIKKEKISEDDENEEVPLINARSINQSNDNPPPRQSENLINDEQQPCSSRQAAAEGNRKSADDKEDLALPTRPRNPPASKTENNDPNDELRSSREQTPNTSSSSYSRRAPAQNRVEDNWEEDEARNANVEENDVSESGRPSVIDFFRFSDQSQVETSMPNVMSSDVETKPIVKPPKAQYYNILPEQEQQYGDESLETIPMYKKNVGSDDEDSGGSDGEPEVGVETGMMQTRYFQKRSAYDKYDFSPEARRVDPTKLTVYEKRSHILNSLEKARVLIIEGFTGCGKTTQVPQYILDKCREDKKVCNIVVTQPRKIAAISVASRVCYERNWNMGSIVGYQVGMERKTDRIETMLTFMTTGVLLQQLISKRSLKDYSHIIIDEVHERDLESDFLLLVIKRILAADVEGKEQHKKLILMSATIDTKRFEDYFVFKAADGEILRPHVIKIPFVARYKIQEIYLDDILKEDPNLLEQIKVNLEQDKAAVQEDIYETAVQCIVAMDDSEKASLPDPRMRNRTGLNKDRGAVLVFLPGMEEIKNMERALGDAEDKLRKSKNDSYGWLIVKLHSSVTSEEQNSVFQKAKDGVRKIILSTNIAESSVTVPDIAYVIDFCLTKSQCVDKTTNFTTLRLMWASQSQCIQRRGRTGRVADGKVFRLIPKAFYRECLDPDITPEMRRSNLESVILKCKKFQFDSPKNLLALALDKPDLSGIQRATATLKELGALTIEMADPENPNRKRYEDCDGDLTFVGQVMSELPIPEQCTRLILLGYCFGVMQEALIIAAGVSVKNPFQIGFRKQLESYLRKMGHSRKTFSDLFALYHVYKEWALRFGDAPKKDWSRERRWAQSCMVHLPALRDIKATIAVLEERLKQLGITDSYALAPNPSDPIELTAEQGLFLKLAIAGAFYPRYFLRRRPDMRQYEKTMQKELNGHDVFRTVYFKGFPSQHKGELYAKHVADFLSYGFNIPMIKFDGQKVLAIFDNSTGDTIGPFNRGIFRALKLRQLRQQLEFNLLWYDKEKDELNRWQAHVQRRKSTPCPDLRLLPPVDCHVVPVKAQHVISPSQFWVILRPDFDKLENVFQIIQANIKNCPSLDRSKICPNALCLAKFGNSFYRAKILRVQPGNNDQFDCLVYFIDYGNTEKIISSALLDFNPILLQAGIHKIPCMAIECRLKKLKPLISLGLQWSPEAIDLTKKFIDRAPNLEFEIFSIYDGIMVGTLYGFQNDATQKANLNDLLTTKSDQTNKLLGEETPEPFFSMENHRVRQNSHIMDEQEKKATNYEQRGDAINLDFIDPPKNARTPCTLKGPWSPLEMNFQALVHCSNTKEVRIENSSVNSVLLDHEPTSSTSRMLVAAHVTVVEKSQSVMVRESTVMPSVAGILSLVCLMFSPLAELRVNSIQSKYTGILCGLGTVPRSSGNAGNMPIHPDNDMEVVFDTEIDDVDIDQINTIRNHISSILRSGRGVNKAETQRILRTQIIKLLQRPRKNIDEEVWPQEEYVWNRVNEQFLQPPSLGLSFHHDDIFQPHRKVALNKFQEEEVFWDQGY